LLIFEGALRKWIFPALSTPLLVVRDPLAIWIFIQARQKGYLQFNPYSFFMILSGLICAFTAITIGHGDLFTAIFGARILVLQFPLIFAIARIFDWEDVIKVGRAMLWISLPMTVLIGLQFYSPQTAWVNKGVGGETVAGFSGALSYFRPPGTFSFTTGVVSFYGLLAAYIFYFWLHSYTVNRMVLIASTACLLIAIPLTISRSAFFEVLVSLIFSMIAAWKRPRYIGQMIAAGVIVIVLYQLVRNQSFFATSTEAFNARFENATESEGGVNGLILDRFLGGMISAVQSAPDLPFFGYGIGLGTNVGSNLLTGKSSFLIAEQEWGRLIGEMGLLFGFIVIIVRTALDIKITRLAMRQLKRVDALSWMLLSFSFILLLQAQWGQPTTLGFSVLGSGLTIAALNTPEAQEDMDEDEMGEGELEEIEEINGEPLAVNG
jgi:hypothetical protein